MIEQTHTNYVFGASLVTEIESVNLGVCVHLSIGCNLLGFGTGECCCCRHVHLTRTAAMGFGTNIICSAECARVKSQPCQTELPYAALWSVVLFVTYLYIVHDQTSPMYCLELRAARLEQIGARTCVHGLVASRACSRVR